ncbi:beta-mannosidase [Microbacterium mangrovi]|uniref:beta-mannosidase n=1 Tax=Microbacterium mangrovi TaxID=1348253 RepID=A0A0B2A9Z6_9MICO|nr:glycoside hydrolase family 2 protein [Microbacterium mangrovi]KHK99999.1 beta-mannosidase [Microbacterium mangrovi]
MTTTTDTSVLRRELHDGWTVRAAGGPVPEAFAGRRVAASVPGVVHLDLLAAGLIPDPYLDDNESALAWIGRCDWTYETAFSVTAEELASRAVHELVFDGLDTVAAVILNGTLLAEVANQHRTYRLDASAVLVAGENRLTVAFGSPVAYADRQSVALGARPRPYAEPFNAIRKSACSFGWDWGIATRTSGIWRPVRLESWSLARLADVRVVATPVADGGRVDATVRIVRAPGVHAAVRLGVEVEVEGASASVLVPADASEATASVDLAAVDLWWPAGHGAQPLSDVAVTLVAGDDVQDAATRRVGFRTVRWNTEPDTDGTPFQLVVNDRPVFVKGVNWIPDDAFFPRVDRDRYARRLGQAKAANVNLVRVWGGGIYEDDAFYDVCDELGLLTWQDFLFACAAYSEDEPVHSEVEAEARDNIVRLGHHASLALLNGNNENLWGYEDWGWKPVLDGRSWGAGYYHELLPALVAELAPHVTYTPGSPFSPGGQHPNDERHGSMHLWEQWNRLDWPTYRDQVPRFVAEFGWQAPPTRTTLRRAIGDDPLTPDSPGMIVHQKAIDGNAKLAAGLVAHVRVPDELDAWVWATQWNQATAVRTALEWFRAHAPRTAGAVVWQLNDCWPVTSWAAIDGDGREKPQLFAMAQAFAPRALLVNPHGDGVAVTVVNETDRPWEGALAVTRRAFDGRGLAAEELPVAVPPWSAVTVATEQAVAAPEHAGSELLVAQLDRVRAHWFFAEPRASALASAELAVEVAPEGDGFAVTVTAAGLVRDLTLTVDQLHPDASVDSGMVTLLPGATHTFRVRGIDRLDAAAVRAPGILRTLNELVVP